MRLVWERERLAEFFPHLGVIYLSDTEHDPEPTV